MVTGPSLSSETFMKAPKRPSLTLSGLYSLPILATKLSQSGAALQKYSFSVRADEINEHGMNLGSSSHCEGQRPHLSATCWGRSAWLKSRRFPFSLPYSVNWLTKRTSPPMSTTLRSHARLPSSDGHSRVRNILRQLHATPRCELGHRGEYNQRTSGRKLAHVRCRLCALSVGRCEAHQTEQPFVNSRDELAFDLRHVHTRQAPRVCLGPAQGNAHLDAGSRNSLNHGAHAAACI